MQKQYISRMKIHIIGPSGSGTSTVGKLLSNRFGIPFFDSDDFFWEKTTIPYSKKNPVEKRKTLLNTMIAENDSWILSGSAMGWGDVLRNEADLIVLLFCEKSERCKRLRKREKEQFGDRIELENDMYENHETFIEWAMSYDEGGLDMRSRASEEAWIKQTKGSVIKLTNHCLDKTVDKIVDTLIAGIYNNQVD
ncbi:MAG: AAA family ATPase [Bacteroidetes bacterium]|nr:AAA family ATPase [Bacteroidota bacterium]